MKKDSYSKEELLACGRGEMFGEANAQLPLPPMLMFDRITKITESGGEYGLGEIIAEMDIKKDLWFFFQYHGESMTRFQMQSSLNRRLKYSEFLNHTLFIGVLFYKKIIVVLQSMRQKRDEKEYCIIFL